MEQNMKTELELRANKAFNIIPAHNTLVLSKYLSIQYKNH